MPSQKERSPSRILVVAALILHRDKLLVCQRRRNDSFPLRWEFPGGKVHRTEAPADALARELREELGVESTIGAEVYRTRHRYAEHPGEIELTFYRATIGDVTAIQNLAFEKIEWATLQALPSYDFLPADRELVKLLANGSLKLPT
jgi:8-oxo-dGTP diphosphatase